MELFKNFDFLVKKCATNRALLLKTLLILVTTAACILAIVRHPLHLGLDLRGGVSLILRVKTEQLLPAQQSEILEQTQQIIERRINAFGLSEATVQPYGSHGNELLVQFPGVSDPAHVRTVLQARGVLEWHSVESGPYKNAQDAFALYGGTMPSNQTLAKTKDLANQASLWYLLDSQALVRGTDLSDAHVAYDNANRPVVAFHLTRAAATRFEHYTQENVGRQCAILVDQQILSAPVIGGAIGDTGQISGHWTYEEAKDLAVSLRSGALPASIDIEQEQTVGASLGADSLRHGLQAGIAGVAAVVTAMLLYYRGAGANAALALLLNGVFLMTALACFGAVLTLPGIAGAILTIGMAVDSNVLIFERIREELRAGKSATAALAAGFSKAFATLLDTHVTTVVSCIFLFLFGTPMLQGFATTLVIGLITNLFTSVFVSRVAFDWELSRRKRPAVLSIGMA